MTKLLRNSRQASSTFDLGGAHAPRPKGLFYVRFVKSDGTPGKSSWQSDLGFLIKTVEQPKVQLKTEELSQYNRKRVVYTGVTYQPISVSFYDTADGMAAQMWDEYASYHFGDFNQKLANYEYDIVSYDGSMKGAETGYGFRPRTGLSDAMDAGSQNFFSRIEIYQVFRNAFTRVFLVNPKLVSYDPEELDYSSLDLLSIRTTIAYEAILYDNGGAPQPIDTDPVLSNVFRDIRMHGDYIEVSGIQGKPITKNMGKNPLQNATPSPVAGGASGGFLGAIKNLAGGGGSSGLGGVLSSFGNFDFGKAASGVVNSLISGRGTKNIVSEALYAGTGNSALRHIASSIEGGLNTNSAVGLAQTYLPGVNPAVFDAARAAVAIKSGDKMLAGGMAAQVVMGVIGAAKTNSGTNTADHVASGSASTGRGGGLSISGVAANAINSVRQTSQIGSNMGGAVGRVAGSVLGKIPGLGGGR